MTDGLVLAGGQATRFGSDKRLAAIDGEELVRRAVRTVVRAIDGATFVATGAGRVSLPGTARVRVIRDSPPGRGPLGGIAAGLELSAEGIVVLACDLPLVRADTLRQLAAIGRRAGRPAALRERGRWEPLVAYYPRRVLKDVRAAIHQGALAPHRLLDKLMAIGVPATDPGEVDNVNTRADLERITRRRSPRR